MRFIYTILLFFSSLSVTSQIDVHQEPLHHPVLKNKIGRVLDIIAQPGDTSLMHLHRSNYCYVTTNGGQIWIQDKDSKGRDFNLYTGYIGGYYENPEKVLVHRFANCDSTTIRIIAVENLSIHGNASDSLFQVPATDILLVNNAFFILTKITIQPKAQLTTQSKRPSVLISLGPKPVQYKEGKKLKPVSQWMWSDPNQKVTLLNAHDELATLILVQLKNEKHSNK